MSAEEGRVPPHDIDAEQAALGGMLLSRGAAAEVCDLVSAVDFYRPAHQIIFEAIAEVLAEGRDPVDVISVHRALERRGQSAATGRAPYLHTLAEAIPTAANAGYYASIVAERAVLRRLTEVGASVAQLGYAGQGDTADLVEDAHRLLSEVEAPATVAGAEMMSAAQVFQAVIDDQDAPEEPGLVATPYRDLRDVVPALKPGQMVIIGARPGTGKTVAAADFARHAAMKQGVGTAVFSLEMTHRELGQRLVAAEASVDFAHLRDKKLDDDSWNRVAAVRERFDAAPLWMSDDFSVSVGHIRARVRRLARTRPVGLVIVDYLQLMEGGASENRQQEVSKMSRGLKKLAGELEVVVVVLSQLNRGSTQRSDKRPQLSDLRESGSLEQDSDVVILLDRPDMRDRESVRAGEVDLIVEKNRHGASGCEVTLAFQGRFSRMVDMAGRNWRD